MSFKNLNNLRVVVHVNKQDSEEHHVSFQNTSFKCGSQAGLKRNRNGQLIVPASPPIHTSQSLNDNSGCENMKAEILIIDDKSLQLNLLSTEENGGPYTIISHKMHFDYVSHSAVDMIKFELPIVMDELLLKHKNSCIMRFITEQEMNITIFFDLFITFLNKRIYHQKYKLQYVKLECLDIAASVGTAKNHPTEKGFAMRANLTDSSLADKIVDDNEASFRLSRNAKNEFRSTRDLLVWLLNEYHFKFADSRGHNKLLFSFSIVDHHQNIFKVKLSLFNIFLNLMNTEERNHWHHYMDHLGEGCKGLDCNFMHSGLTVSLSGHIEGTASESALLLFDVPTNIKMATDTIEMIQMAHSVIKNRKRKLALLSKNAAFNRRVLSPFNDCAKCLCPKWGEEFKNNLDSNPKNERRSLPIRVECLGMELSSSMPYIINETSLGSYSNYSSKDLNTLSAWYGKIDECFENHCQLREKYFNRYFKLKTKQISSSIKNMYRSLESLYPPQSEHDLVELQKDQIELHELFESYNNVRTLFRHLSDDIQGKDFAEILIIYLETKTFDLNKQALVLKQKHLESCQQHLKFTFDNLFNSIKLEFDILK